MTETAEITEILSMPPGSRVCYFRGYLPRDRKRADVNDTAKIAWKLHAAGKVILAQRRVGDMVYEYIAVRRSEPKRKKDTSGALASQLRVTA